MDITTLEQLELITKIGSNLTVAGVMTIFLYLFITGQIVSRKTVDQIIAGLVAQIKNDMETKFDELGKKLDKANSRGW